MQFTQMTTSALAQSLKAQGIKRFYVMTLANGEVIGSHPFLSEWIENLKSGHDFEAHEGLFFEISDQYDVIHGAFVHRTCRGQAQGGTRFWQYPTFQDFALDGIRLSKGMTHKNALAGLWWGGGKGVISRPADQTLIQNQAFRKEIFAEYGRFISSLQGCYITAEDVGTNTDDMGFIFSETRFITCIPPKVGGSGNPSSATAMGVVKGMQAGLAHLQLGSLSGKKVVVQGVGNVGKVIVDLVLAQGAHVIASDISESKCQALRDEYQGKSITFRYTPIDDFSILYEPCDILCPAATGAVLNEKTIPLLNTKLVCGAANNQLKNPKQDGQLLADRQITYLPDFLVNRMGIVNCCNEQYGYVDQDPSFLRHLSDEWEYSVYQTSLNVLKRAQDDQTHPHLAAVALADERSRLLHPIWGHRGIAIIHTLKSKNWALI
jgi:glutamate dehydrogenase/leucine dehydrogenase